MSFIRSCVSLPLRAEYANPDRAAGPVPTNAHGAWYLFGVERGGFQSRCRLQGSNLPERRFRPMSESLTTLPRLQRH